MEYRNLNIHPNQLKFWLYDKDGYLIKSRDDMDYMLMRKWLGKKFWSGVDENNSWGFKEVEKRTYLTTYDVQAEIRHNYEHICLKHGGELWSCVQPIIVLDATSLYPSAMTQNPTFVNSILTQENPTPIQLWDKDLHGSTINDIIGLEDAFSIVTVKYIVPPPNKVFSIFTIRPFVKYLPPSVEKSILWYGGRVENYTLTNIDAIKFFDMRLKAKSYVKQANKVGDITKSAKFTNEQESLKLILNSSYGMVGMREIMDNIYIQDLDLVKCSMKNQDKFTYDVTPINDHQSIFSTIDVDGEYKSIMPSHLAVQVLTYSKAIMN